MQSPLGRKVQRLGHRFWDVGMKSRKSPVPETSMRVFARILSLMYQSGVEACCRQCATTRSPQVQTQWDSVQKPISRQDQDRPSSIIFSRFSRPHDCSLVYSYGEVFLLWCYRYHEANRKCCQLAFKYVHKFK